LPSPTRLDPEAAVAALRRDRVLGPFIRAHGGLDIRPPKRTHFEALARAIVFQQLAGRAAMAIYGRVVTAVGGRLTAAALLATDDASLRAAGLSGNKLAALRDLATKSTDGTVPLAAIGRLTDERIVERLVQVRGIGVWTAEMFLLFQLQRPDVWPVDDFGVRAGYARLHGMATPPTPKELVPLGDRFRPYRSAAAWYCWRAVEVLPPA
jgi:DNA-3-methyladenine glycosylase II